MSRIRLLVICAAAAAAALAPDVSIAQLPFSAQIIQGTVDEGERWNGSLRISYTPSMNGNIPYGQFGSFGIEDFLGGSFSFSGGATGSGSGSIGFYDPIPDAGSPPFNITDLVSGISVAISGGNVFFQDTNGALAYSVGVGAGGDVRVYRQTSSNPFNAWTSWGTTSAGTSTTLQFSVVNVAPTVTQALFGSNPFSLTSGPFVVNEGGTVYTRISATDPGADSLGFFFQTDVSSGFIGSGGSSPGSTRVTGTVAVQVFDGFRIRVQDDDTSTFFQPSNLIINNLNPIINSFTLPTTLLAQELFNFGATATDPGLDHLTFDWDLDGDGLFDDYLGAAGQYSFTTAGTRTVGLRVSDGDGGFAYRSQLVDVSAVPEPSSLALLGIGGVIGAMRFRRRPSITT